MARSQDKLLTVRAFPNNTHTPYGDDHTLVRDTPHHHLYVSVHDSENVPRYDHYSSSCIQYMRRLHPYNHSFWMISDQYGSFHLPVRKTPDFTYQDILQDLFLLGTVNGDYIVNIIHDREIRTFDDIVSLDTMETIVYILRHVLIEVHMHDVPTRLHLQLSPLTTVSQLQQLLEIHTSVSKHQLVIGYAATEFVTELPHILHIGTPHADSSDSATHGTQVTDLTFHSTPSLDEPPHLSLQDDPTLFGQIPLYYWFNDVDMDYVFSRLCANDLLWISPTQFIDSQLTFDLTIPFLAAFTYEQHWYAIIYQPQIQPNRILFQSTLFVPCNISPAQLFGLTTYLQPKLPNCHIQLSHIPLVSPGLCGPALVQGVMTWFACVNTAIPRLSDRSSPYCSFDYTQNTLFSQAYDFRKILPGSYRTSRYRAGMHSTVTPPDPVPTHTTPTTLELVQSCATEENQHPLLTATSIQHFPVRMRNLTRRNLPPSIPLLTHLELLEDSKPPAPPPQHIHATFYAHETLWRKNLVLPLFLHTCTTYTGGTTRNAERSL